MVALALGLAVVLGVGAGVMINNAGVALPFIGGPEVPDPTLSTSGLPTLQGDPTKDGPADPESADPTSTDPEPGDPTEAADPPTSGAKEPSRRPFDGAYDKVQSGLVRVISSACVGSGWGSGLLINDTTVITSAFTVMDPAAIAVVVGDQTIEATLTANEPVIGIAVLTLKQRAVGHHFTVVEKQYAVGDAVAVVGLETFEPKPVMTVGRVTATTITKGDPFGTITVDTGMKGGFGGAAVITTDGKLAGLIMDGDVDIPMVAAGGVGLTQALTKPTEPNPQSQCLNGAGPKITTVSGTASPMIMKSMSTYFTGINDGDYEKAYDQLGPAMRKKLSLSTASAGWRTSHDFKINIRGLGPTRAQATFSSIFAEGKGPKNTTTCANWTVDYQFIETGGEMLINAVKATYKHC